MRLLALARCIKAAAGARYCTRNITATIIRCTGPLVVLKSRAYSGPPRTTPSFVHESAGEKLRVLPRHLLSEDDCMSERLVPPSSELLVSLIKKKTLSEAIDVATELVESGHTIEKDLWPKLLCLCIDGSRYDLATMRRIEGLMDKVSDMGECPHTEAAYETRLFIARQLNDPTIAAHVLSNIRTHSQMQPSRDLLNAAMSVCSRLLDEKTFNGYLETFEKYYECDQYTLRNRFLLETGLKRINSALKIMEQLRSSGYKVTEKQWKRLLAACVKAKMIDRAYELIGDVSDDCLPTFDTFRPLCNRHLEPDRVEFLPALLQGLLDINVWPDSRFCNLLQSTLPRKLAHDAVLLLSVSEKMLEAFTSRRLETPHSIVELNFRALSNGYTVRQDHPLPTRITTSNRTRPTSQNTDVLDYRAPLPSTNSDQMEVINMLKSCMEDSRIYEAVDFIENRLRRNLSIPRDCWLLLLKMCITAPKKDTAVVHRIVSLMDRASSERGEILHSSTSFGLRLNIAQESGNSGIAQEVLWNMQKYPDVEVSPELLNAAMCVCARLRDRDTFNGFLELFKAHNCEIQDWTWRAMFSLEGNLLDVRGCIRVMEDMRRSNFRVTESHWRKVLNLMVHHGMYEQAREQLPRIAQDCQPTSALIASLLRSHLSISRFAALPELFGEILDTNSLPDSNLCRNTQDRLLSMLNTDSVTLTKVSEGILGAYLNRELEPPKAILHLALQALSRDATQPRFGTTQDLTQWIHRKHPNYCATRLQKNIESLVFSLPATEFVALFQPTSAEQAVLSGAESELPFWDVEQDIVQAVNFVTTGNDDLLDRTVAHIVSRALESEGKVAQFIVKCRAIFAVIPPPIAVCVSEELMRQLLRTTDPTSSSKCFHRRRRLMKFMYDGVVTALGAPTPSCTRHFAALLIDIGKITAALDVLESCPVSHLDSGIFKTIFVTLLERDDFTNTERALLMCVDTGVTLDTETLEAAVKAYLQKGTPYGLMTVLEGVFRDHPEPQAEQVALQIIVWHCFETETYDRALQHAQKLQSDTRYSILVKGIELVASRGQLTRALRLYQKACTLGQISPEIGHFNAMIKMCAQRQQKLETVNRKEVYSFLESMRAFGLKPTSVSWEWAMDLLCESTDSNVALELLSSMKALDDIEPTPKMFRTALASLSKNRMLKQAHELLQRGHDMGWTFGPHELQLFMDRFATSREVSQTHQLLVDLLRRYPEESTACPIVDVVLNSWARQDLTRPAAWLIRYIEQRQYKLSSQSRRSVETMGSFETLLKLLEEDVKPYD